MRLSILMAASACLFATVGSILPAAAQSAATHTLITEKIDDTKLVTLEGNTRPEATAANDAGKLADDYALDHLMLQLKRPADREVAFDHLIEAQSDINSAEYHHWLSAEQVGQRYGVATEDLNTITKWLTDHGFKVNRIYNNHMLIDFSGTAGRVRTTFNTEMHALSVGGKRHISNMSDPRIPAALAPAIQGIVSLNDFFPRATMLPRADYTYTVDKFTYQALVPGDLAEIYDLNPLFKAGITGKGQTIAVFEDTNVFTTADWTTFRKTFGLSTYTAGSFKQVHPGTNCTNPGVNGDDGEAILDAEWSSAAAPNAAIVLASCADTETAFGALTAFQNIIAEKAPPKIASISYGECESEDGAAFNSSVKKAFQQAASEGISVFVSTGDSAADVCDRDVTPVAQSGISVNGLASTVYNVAVGGTDFEDSYLKKNTTYWNAKNTATFESAKSYVPEIPWNDSCASSLLAKFVTKSGSAVTYGDTGFCNLKGSVEDGFINFAGASGGPSECATGAPDSSNTAIVSGTCKGTPKPSWQSVFGNPKDEVRDLPDVSLFAANGLWGHYYVFCYSDTEEGGVACKGAPSGWSGAGGTSFSSPIMAGIQSLVNEKTKSAQGNPAPTYYKLAAKEYGTAGSTACNSSGATPSAAACIFHDVTVGDMDIPCQGSVNCYWPSGVYGVLSTSDTAFKPAYAATKGWDFATGIGSVDAAKLVNGWPMKAATTTETAINALSD